MAIFPRVVEGVSEEAVRPDDEAVRLEGRPIVPSNTALRLATNIVIMGYDKFSSYFS